MKVSLAPRQKGAAPPAWLFVSLGLVTCFVAAKLLTVIPIRLVPSCGFRTATGHPCPTCGATRLILHLMAGRWQAAFKSHPFFFVLLAGLSLWVIAGAAATLLRRDLRIEMAPREERWLWVLLGSAFLANWAYLWIAGI